MLYSELTQNYGLPLCERKGDGIIVSLFARKISQTVNSWDVRVYYSDKKTGESFTLNPPQFLAIDAWKNPIPYADAAMRGIENPFRLVPAYSVAS